MYFLFSLFIFYLSITIILFYGSGINQRNLRRRHWGKEESLKSNKLRMFFQISIGLFHCQWRMYPMKSCFVFFGSKKSPFSLVYAPPSDNFQSKNIVNSGSWRVKNILALRFVNTCRYLNDSDGFSINNLTYNSIYPLFYMSFVPSSKKATFVV